MLGIVVEGTPEQLDMLKRYCSHEEVNGIARQYDYNEVIDVFQWQDGTPCGIIKEEL